MYPIVDHYRPFSTRYLSSNNLSSNPLIPHSSFIPNITISLSSHILPSFALSSFIQQAYLPARKKKNTKTNTNNLITTKNRDLVTVSTLHHLVNLPTPRPTKKHPLPIKREARGGIIHRTSRHVCSVEHQIKNGMKMLWICIIGRYHPISPYPNPHPDLTFPHLTNPNCPTLTPPSPQPTLTLTSP